MKVTRPPGSTSLVARLPDVVQQRAEAQRLGAGELVAERPGQHPLDARGLPGAEHLRQALLQLDLPGQHLERVVVDVEVVVVALLDPVEGGQLGQDRLEHAEAVGQLQPGDCAVRDDQAAQLQEDALARGARHVRRGGAGEPLGLGVRRRSPAPRRSAAGAGRAAGRARRPRARSRAASRPSRSARPPSGSIRSPPSKGRASAFTVKSRRRRSSSIVSPCSGEKSQTRPPLRSITRQAPNASESRNTGPRTSFAQRPGGPGRVAGDGDVVVAHRPAEQLVAQVAPPTIQAPVSAHVLAAHPRRRARR